MAKYSTWEVAAAHAADKGKEYSEKALLIARVMNFVNSHMNLTQAAKLSPIAVLSNFAMERDMVEDCTILCKLLSVEEEDVKELLDACDVDAKKYFDKKEG